MSDSPIVIPYNPYEGVSFAETMASKILFSDPTEFRTAAEAAIEALFVGIKDGKDLVKSKIEGLTDQDLVNLGFIKITGGDLIASVVPGLGAVAHAVRKGLLRQVDEMIDGVLEKAKEVREQVKGVLNMLMGDPDKLMAIGLAYQSAGSIITEAASDAASESGLLGKYWQTGGSYLGYDAFKIAYEGQVKSMRVFPSKLETAASLLSQIAEMLKSAWSEVVQALQTLAIGIVDTIASACDAGNVVLGEIGPVTSFIARGYEFITDCLKPLQDVNTKSESEEFMEWASLSTAADGMDSHWTWPKSDDDNQAELSDPDQWRIKPNVKDSRP